MTANRDDLLDWLAQGRLAAHDLTEAWRLAGIAPDRSRWLSFLERLCLWLGVVALCAALIFFLAYNWQALGRYAKFGIAELAILAAVAVAWRTGVDGAAGKAAVCAIALLIGALLALVGQTYQTGADTFELFAAWAAAILPLALLARLGALWVFWLALVNLACILYFHAVGLLLWMVFDARAAAWTLLAVDTLALVAWEAAAWRGIPWLQERWSPRIVATAAGSAATLLAIWAIVEREGARLPGALAWGAWMAAAYAYYRHRRRDVFVLAGGVLSAVAVVATLLGKLFLRHDAGGAFLLIGMVVIGLSAAGGMWLRRVAQEEGA